MVGGGSSVAGSTDMCGKNAGIMGKSGNRANGCWRFG